MLLHAPSPAHVSIPAIVHNALISDTWAIDSLCQIRDALIALDGMEALASKLSEAIGGLSAKAEASVGNLQIAPRTISDGLPGDFEDSAGFDTPLDVLALSLPPISGGAPEPFVPSEADWQDYADATDDRDWYREIDAIAAGLPI